MQATPYSGDDFQDISARNLSTAVISRCRALEQRAEHTHSCNILLPFLVVYAVIPGAGCESFRIFSSILSRERNC